MKTLKFKISRVFCYLFITAIVINSIVYFGIYLWKREVLNMEKIMLYGNLCTLKSFSLYLIYLNLLNAFSLGYAFNISSKSLLQWCLWFSLGTISAGLAASSYLYQYIRPSISTVFNTSFFSNDMLSSKMMARYLSTTSFTEIQRLYEEEYSFMMKYFLIFEVISLIMLSLMSICGLFARFVTINEYKPRLPPIHENVVGIENNIS